MMDIEREFDISYIYTRTHLQFENADELYDRAGCVNVLVYETRPIEYSIYSI